MRPINNVVDVTNYVMLAWGQPLHAFDADKIEGGTLIVRRARPARRSSRSTASSARSTADMLRHRRRGQPLVIAGVLGAVDAEVDETHQHVVLEAATFDGPNIMRTSKEFGLRSEASNRFEKGLDAECVPRGLALASRLFHELCGGSRRARHASTCAATAADAGARGTGRPSATRCSASPWPRPSRPTSSAPRNARSTGRAAASDVCVTPPTFRPDLEREVDLIEEVGRIHGSARCPRRCPAARAGGVLKAQRLRRARGRPWLAAVSTRS